MQIIFILIICFANSLSSAASQLGMGFSSISAGHNTPEVSLGVGGNDWLLLNSSAGFKTTAYYQSNYFIRYYKTWNAGNLFWGKISFGAGGGVMFAKRGFKDIGASEETATDFVYGPTIRGQWNIAGPIYLALDGLLGIGQVWQVFALNVQDCVSLSVGISTW